jgi:hypothetical protein
MPPLVTLLDLVVAWAKRRSDIVGVALVGSWARGNARPTSDIDLMLLTPDPEAFRSSSAWLDEIDWAALGASMKSSRDVPYGAAWSRHVELDEGTSVEFSFARPNWASTSPCDPGTRAVVSRGCRVLHDPTGILQRLVQNAAAAVAVTLDKQQSRQRVAEIRQLWNEWDPIGVAEAVPDEYDAYLAPTLRLLERNASVDEIIEYLNWVTLEHMGLSQISDPRQFVALLQEWFATKWAGTRVPGT